MAARDALGQSLQHTPTWALSVVCFVIVSTSIIMEHSIHLTTNWLKRRRKTSLSSALDRVKSELMLLGFISLLLAVTQDTISNICIPLKAADIMLPCRKHVASQTSQFQTYQNLVTADNVLHRHLLSEDEDASENDVYSNSCSSKRMVALITEEGIQQLQIFIFVLACTHVVYSVLTMALGRAKMRSWKAWEKETQTTEYQVANDPNRFRYARQTTFARRHMTFTKSPLQLWIKCFFRQFFNSVAKVDYITMRHGFISAHLSTQHANFNFQKYIQRALEEDFKVVVSISPIMWLIAVIFMLVDVHGWNVFFWVSYVPLLVVLVMGAKLEVIVARMALQINNQNSVIKGTPLVRPDDNHFWFRHPKFILILLRYTLFTNAFEMAFFVWVAILFGWNSCYHEQTAVIVTRIILAVTVQVLCSYMTLPLYALVTQMGSQYRSKVLEEKMANIIKQWHTEVRERRKNQEQASFSALTSLSIELRNPTNTIPTELSSSPSLTPTTRESIHNKGEITEEEEEDSFSSRGRPRQPRVLEMPTVRR